MSHRSLLVLTVAGALSATSVLSAQSGSTPPAPAPAAKPAPAPEAPKADEFGIGVKAPTLEGAKWIKGSPVTTYEKGQIYVLDFWATWCAPCIAGIPHLADIQTKYADKGVNVIGLAIWPREGQKPTKDFVEERGDKMPYRIADDVDNLLARRFMQPAGINGIPTVMIVDGEGLLAWIGHPSPAMDRALDRVINEPGYAKKRGEINEKASVLGASLNEAAKNSDWATCLDIMDQFLELDPKDFADFALFKYDVYVSRMQDYSAAKTYGRTLIENGIAKDPELLGMLASYIVNPNTDVPEADRDFELAMLAAQKANTLSEGKDASVLDTLARVHFAKGDVPEAVRVQTMAVELSKDPRMKAEFQRALDKYTKAAAGEG